MNLSPNVQQSREKSKNPIEANTAPERERERETNTHTHRASYITYMYTTYSQAPPPRLLQQMKDCRKPIQKFFHTQEICTLWPDSTVINCSKSALQISREIHEQKSHEMFSRSHVLSVSVSVCVCMQCKSVLTLIPNRWGCSKMWLEMD
jgi:hypothetical protein